MPISVIGRPRACLAALSAALFPWIPVWQGIHHKLINVWRSSISSLCSLRKGINNAFLKSQPYSSCNADSEPEQMVNLSFWDLDICSRASSKAFNAAEDTVAPSGSRQKQVSALV